MELLNILMVVYLMQDLQDEMTDMLDMHEEVQEALGRTYGMPEIDDDELQAELDALGDEIALDDDTSYLDEVKSPAAPSKEPGADSVRNKVSINRPLNVLRDSPHQNKENVCCEQLYKESFLITN